MKDLIDFLFSRMCEEENRGRSSNTGLIKLSILSSWRELGRDLSPGREPWERAAWAWMLEWALPYADHPDYREEWRP